MRMSVDEVHTRLEREMREGLAEGRRAAYVAFALLQVAHEIGRVAWEMREIHEERKRDRRY